MQAAQRRLLARRARLQRVAAVAGLSWEAAKDVAGLVVFSALPFVAVQALADSQAGKDLMARLEEQKPLLQREAAQRERERAAARSQRCAAGIRMFGWHLVQARARRACVCACSSASGCTLIPASLLPDCNELLPTCKNRQ